MEYLSKKALWIVLDDKVIQICIKHILHIWLACLILTQNVANNINKQEMSVYYALWHYDNVISLQLHWIKFQQCSASS